MLNVDGGYLTFKLAFGGFDTWQLKNGEATSIFAMDNKPKRRKLFSDYKKNRNAGKENIIKMVWELRKKVENDQRLPLCNIEGLEADDIVACYQMFNPECKLVGVDKDFFQIPKMEKVYYHNLLPYTKAATIKKLPLFIQPLALKNFALYQILMGDVADNISRLLARSKEGKQQVEIILDAMERGCLAGILVDLFGIQVKLNAQLVLFPYFSYCESSDWFESWAEGDYYKTNNWGNLYTMIQENTLSNKCADSTRELRLFSLM